MGCQFQLSALSFFQVNTAATELLYAKCGDWATDVNDIGTSTVDRSGMNENKKTVLLDLCCGTGTIGITLAKRFSRVIGIELIADAVKDAERHAKANGICFRSVF